MRLYSFVTERQIIWGATAHTRTHAHTFFTEILLKKKSKWHGLKLHKMKNSQINSRIYKWYMRAYTLQKCWTRFSSFSQSIICLCFNSLTNSKTYTDEIENVFYSIPFFSRSLGCCRPLLLLFYVVSLSLALSLPLYLSFFSICVFLLLRSHGILVFCCCCRWFCCLFGETKDK